MTRKSFLMIFILITAVIVTSISMSAQTKKRVAVFAFEDKTDHQWHWWTGQPVGEGMADMLITELVKSGKYQVIERQAIDKIMQEQQLGQTGMITPQSAAKVGQLLGVELAIIGSVTEFGYKKSDIGGVLKKQGFGLGVQSASASVGIDVRFVNTNTGEIIAADNVRKEESKKGLKLDTQQFSFKNKSEFDESLVGKATRKAIEEIMTKLDNQLGNLPWQAKVIKVADNMVYINAGAEAGLRVGDVLVVVTRGEELVDPDTGLSLGAEEKQVGVIEVVDNSIGNGKASKCKIKSGGGFNQGDLVRQQPTK